MRTGSAGLSVPELVELVAEIKKKGSRPYSLAALPSKILDHPVIVEAAIAGSNTAKAYAFLMVFDEALSELGDPAVNPRALATRHLFGMSPDSRGRILKHRRRLAADALYLKVKTITEIYEDEFVLDVAAALHITLIRRSVELGAA